MPMVVVNVNFTGIILFVMLFGFAPFHVDPTRYFGEKESIAVYKLIKKGFKPEVKKGFGPSFPRGMAISKDGRDFISKLLEMDCAKRFTAHEALQHPWIKNLTTIASDNNYNNINGQMNDEVAIEFGNFAHCQQLKYAISGFFRDQFIQMKPRDFISLKKLFSKFDTGENGKISLNQFENGFLQHFTDIKLNNDEIFRFKVIFKQMNMKNYNEIGMRFCCVLFTKHILHFEYARIVNVQNVQITNIFI